MLIALLVLLVLIILAIWITGAIIGLVFHLLLAGLIGWIADALLPGRVPYGLLGLVVAGLVGGWVGSLLLSHFGPSLFGLNLIPTLVGTVIVVAIVGLITRGRATLL